jgi:hypothetical protein
MKKDGGGGGAAEAARLAAIKTRQCEAARERILSGELERASAHLDTAELLDRLARLAAPRPRPARSLPALALLGACVALAFAAWKVRLGTFADLEVSIRGETTAAQLTLARATTLDALRGGAVDLGRLSGLTAQISDMPRALAEQGWLRIQESPVVIRGLRAAEGARLAVALTTPDGGRPALALRAYGKGIEGELLVRPGALVSAGAEGQPAVPGSRLTGDALDVVTFRCDDCAAVPLRVDVPHAEPFTFGNVPVGQLAFAVEQAHPDGTVDFSSGLGGGVVRLLDAQRTETIEAGDNLKLDIASARRFQIGRTAKGESLSFVFEGTVKRASLGPVGAERDLSPSLLEFFYRQKAVALLWGAAVFLWGLFKAGRELLQRRST